MNCLGSPPDRRVDLWRTPPLIRCDWQREVAEAIPSVGETGAKKKPKSGRKNP
jgi:hypothetical protein